MIPASLYTAEWNVALLKRTDLTMRLGAAGGLCLLLAAGLTLRLFSIGRAAGTAAYPSLTLALFTACGVLALLAIRKLETHVLWLEGTLDAVPQPVTVTDLDMRWVFVNRVTEGLLSTRFHKYANVS